jgi:hypothetical protein
MIFFFTQAKNRLLEVQRAYPDLLSVADVRNFNSELQEYIETLRGSSFALTEASKSARLLLEIEREQRQEKKREQVEA